MSNTFGFTDALLLMRTGRPVRPVGYLGYITLSMDGKSFEWHATGSGLSAAFEPSPAQILSTEWEYAT